MQAMNATGSGLQPYNTGALIYSADARNTPDWYLFGSNHPSVINFAFADGSVRTISKGADAATLIKAAGMQDNYAVNWTLIGQ
jgi:prepilin-type processing-associated H-X9-DG protein